MDVTLRALTLADLASADRIYRAAYRTEMDCRPRLRRCLQLQPDGWLLALLDGLPVGMGGAVDYGAFAYVGMMGVHPMAQRRGVGAALLEHLLAWLDRSRCPTTLLDASNAGEPLYARFGFVSQDRVVHWEASTLTPSAPIPDASSTIQVMELALDDLNAVTAFDAPCFGAGRAAIFAFLQLDHPGRALVARNRDGAISGYIFVQERVLGPWVARDEIVAEALLARALTLPLASPITVFAPEANEHAGRLFERYGFRKMRTLSHMRRGEPVYSRQRSLIYGQASLGLG